MEPDTWCNCCLWGVRALRFRRGTGDPTLGRVLSWAGIAVGATSIVVLAATGLPANEEFFLWPFLLVLLWMRGDQPSIWFRPEPDCDAGRRRSA